ncbi:PTS lactose/cellobiose transporter subunit IIA [Anaerosacchariphilus polymeriproducens]|uniref:PTS lactose/cellobiose transporter subunit IIA n=1 Tax=Anaerosacchariphilus polymeriproducens TaxID=1812858 RepID=A0A371AYW2_9FIRM|nr:PTS lactose/cellobiose transporter subunit IIA [Anaerosacchariphilus polymeriproducens]RDU24692.1 PTS lactose/cellobiose transporter subunit IIA [Anaerosacchariphilus polymeriproducens]
MEEYMENELVSVAMQIILNAGDARNAALAALDAVKTGDFTEAKKKIEEAKASIRLAHVSQTEVIQNETRGKTYQPSLLFTHAQDTIMTINSEVILAEQLLGLFENVYKKIESL